MSKFHASLIKLTKWSQHNTNHRTTQNVVCLMNLTFGTHDIRFSDFHLSNYVFVDPYIEPTTVLEESTYSCDNFSHCEMQVYLAFSSCFVSRKSKEIPSSTKSMLISRRPIIDHSIPLKTWNRIRELTCELGAAGCTSMLPPSACSVEVLGPAVLKEHNNQCCLAIDLKDYFIDF